MIKFFKTALIATAFTLPLITFTSCGEDKDEEEEPVAEQPALPDDTDYVTIDVKTRTLSNYGHFCIYKDSKFMYDFMFQTDLAGVPSLSIQPYSVSATGETEVLRETGDVVNIVSTVGPIESIDNITRKVEPSPNIATDRMGYVYCPAKKDYGYMVAIESTTGVRHIRIFVIEASDRSVTLSYQMY